MYDIITLRGLTASGTHGVYAFEQEQPQPFIADVAMWVDISHATLTDNIEKTVSYADVAADVAEILEGPSVRLIETLADRIAQRIMEYPMVAGVQVVVHKPKAPLTQDFSDVSVTVRRGYTDVEYSVVDAVNEAFAHEHQLSPEGLNSNDQNPNDQNPDRLDPNDRNPKGLTSGELGFDGLNSNEASEEPLGYVAPTALRVPVPFVLAFGGNEGNVPVTLRRALEMLIDSPEVDIRDVSPLLRTAAVVKPGMDPQEDHWNMVALGTTTLSPHALLALTSQIENALGRERPFPWAPRTIDIDIITMGQEVINDDTLQLPHPRAYSRAFVLLPWLLIDPDAELSGYGRAVDLVIETTDRHGVRDIIEDWYENPDTVIADSNAIVDPPATAPAPVSAPASVPVSSTASAADSAVGSAPAAHLAPAPASVPAAAPGSSLALTQVASEGNEAAAASPAPQERPSAPQALADTASTRASAAQTGTDSSTDTRPGTDPSPSTDARAASDAHIGAAERAASDVGAATDACAATAGPDRGHRSAGGHSSRRDFAAEWAAFNKTVDISELRYERSWHDEPTSATPGRGSASTPSHTDSASAQPSRAPSASVPPATVPPTRASYAAPDATHGRHASAPLGGVPAAAASSLVVPPIVAPVLGAASASSASRPDATQTTVTPPPPTRPRDTGTRKAHATPSASSNAPKAAAPTSAGRTPAQPPQRVEDPASLLTFITDQPTAASSATQSVASEGSDGRVYQAPSFDEALEVEQPLTPHSGVSWIPVSASGMRSAVAASRSRANEVPDDDFPLERTLPLPDWDFAEKHVTIIDSVDEADHALTAQHSTNAHHTADGYTAGGHNDPGHTAAGHTGAGHTDAAPSAAAASSSSEPGKITVDPDLPEGTQVGALDTGSTPALTVSRKGIFRPTHTGAVPVIKRDT